MVLNEDTFYIKVVALNEISNEDTLLIFFLDISVHADARTSPAMQVDTLVICAQCMYVSWQHVYTAWNMYKRVRVGQ